MRRAKPAKPKVEAKPPIARKSPKTEASRVRDLEMRLAEALKREAEALEQQTATGEILRVISSSPTDLQPVLMTVAQNAARVCGAIDALIYRVEGEFLHWVASHGPIPPTTEERLISRGWVTGRAVVDRRTIHVHDLAAESDTEYPVGKAAQRQTGHRTTLATPLLRKGVPLGVISIRRMEVRPFSETQVTLLETFADQAVIAIENVRLFTELQEKNRALTDAHAQVTEALEQQTATGEILRAISGSPTDTQPVFDTIAANAARLCAARDAQVLRVDGDILRLVSASGSPSMAPVRSISRDHAVGRAVIDRQTVHVRDMAQAVMEFPETSAPQHGVESLLAVPLLRNDVAVGVIRISRTQVQPFTDAQIALLQTFADQAVIAIENVRLFTELGARNRDLTEALEQQTATSEILRTIAQAQTDAEPVFDTIVRSAARLCHAATAVIFLTDGVVLHRPASYGVSPEAHRAVQARFPRPLDRDTAAGTAILTRSLVHVPDVEAPSALDFLRQTGRAIGFRSLLSVPMLREAEVVGAINVTRQTPGRFSDAEVALLKTFADQAVIAVENVRLFKELEAANRELGAASRHKSEFLANMSHELRTPLNAVIGFSEVLLQRMFGALNDKQDEYLKDIYASGQHLLSLINDILDLSKIEAGRMELAPAPFHLPTALENAVTLVKERAARHSITLELDLDPRLGELVGDERKVKQVLLNLLSNAVKFTPEGGRITVKAGRTDEAVEIAVTDTGIGIAPEDQAAIFEEFRQVGTDDARKLEGTGLGLTLAKKFVELHDGRMWVQSELGRGSTFTFTLPVS